MSRGDSETNKLKENIEEQLKRLLTQLQDVEEMRNDMDEEEYIQTRQETIDQMKEFEISLNKMVSGNMSLVDQVGSVQLAIQSAIRSVTSPAILNMFLKKENGSLRTRLNTLESDYKLNKINHENYVSQSAEILQLLEKLGDVLSTRERELLNQHVKNLSGYTAAANETDIIVDEKLVKVASNQIKP
eukprot:gene13570-18211_t